MFRNAAASNTAKRMLRIQLEGGHPTEVEMQAAINAGIAEFRSKLELCSEIIGERLSLRSVVVDPQVCIAAQRRPLAALAPRRARGAQR